MHLRESSKLRLMDFDTIGNIGMHILYIVPYTPDRSACAPINSSARWRGVVIK